MDILTREKTKGVDALSKSEVLITYDLDENKFEYTRYTSTPKLVENKGLKIELEDGRSGQNVSIVYLPVMAEVLISKDDIVQSVRAKDLKADDTLLKYKVVNSSSSCEYVKVKSVEQAKETHKYYKMNLDKFVILDKILVKV